MNSNQIDFNNNNYAFDYDNTLSNHLGMRELAKYLLSLNKEVFICTKRYPDEQIEHGSTEVFLLAENLGIPPYNCIFTSDNDKSPFLIHNEIEEYWDDELSNIQEINTNAPDIITHLVK